MDAFIVASVASAVGCCLAMAISKRLSRDRLFVNAIMSDNREAMQDLRGFLTLHHIILLHWLDLFPRHLRQIAEIRRVRLQHLQLHRLRQRPVQHPVDVL